MADHSLNVTFFPVFFIPFVFQHLSFPIIPIIIHTVVSVQCFLSEISAISSEVTKWWWLHVFGKDILYLRKQNYSNKSHWNLSANQKMMCDQRMARLQKSTVSKPSVCVRLECVSGKHRPKPSPFFKWCCKGEFMLSSWSCWEDVFPSAD